MIYICLRLLDTCAAFGAFDLAQSVIKRFQSAIPSALRHREDVTTSCDVQCYSIMHGAQMIAIFEPFENMLHSAANLSKMLRIFHEQPISLCPTAFGESIDEKSIESIAPVSFCFCNANQDESSLVLQRLCIDHIIGHVILWLMPTRRNRNNPLNTKCVHCKSSLDKLSGHVWYLGSGNTRASHWVNILIHFQFRPFWVPIFISSRFSKLDLFRWSFLALFRIHRHDDMISSLCSVKSSNDNKLLHNPKR